MIDLDFFVSKIPLRGCDVSSFQTDSMSIVDFFCKTIKDIESLNKYSGLIKIFSGGKKILLGKSPSLVEQEVSVFFKKLRGWTSLGGLQRVFCDLTEKMQVFFDELNQEKKRFSQRKESILFLGLDTFQTMCGCVSRVYDSLSFLEATFRFPPLKGFSDVCKNIKLVGVGLGAGIRVPMSGVRICRYFSADAFLENTSLKELGIHTLKVIESTSSSFAACALLSGLPLRPRHLTALNSISSVTRFLSTYCNKIL